MPPNGTPHVISFQMFSSVSEPGLLYIQYVNFFFFYSLFPYWRLCGDDPPAGYNNTKQLEMSDCQ